MLEEYMSLVGKLFLIQLKLHQAVEMLFVTQLVTCLTQVKVTNGSNEKVVWYLLGKNLHDRIIMRTPENLKVVQYYDVSYSSNTNILCRSVSSMIGTP